MISLFFPIVFSFALMNYIIESHNHHSVVQYGRSTVFLRYEIHKHNGSPRAHTLCLTRASHTLLIVLCPCREWLDAYACAYAPASSVAGWLLPPLIPLKCFASSDCTHRPLPAPTLSLFSHPFRQRSRHARARALRSLGSSFWRVVSALRSSFGTRRHFPSRSRAARTAQAGRTGLARDRPSPA